MLEDLYFEHDDMHTSDDWDRLKDECSSCYKAIQSVRNMVSQYTNEEPFKHLDHYLHKQNAPQEF